MKHGSKAISGVIVRSTGDRFAYGAIVSSTGSKFGLVKSPGLDRVCYLIVGPETKYGITALPTHLQNEPLGTSHLGVLANDNMTISANLYQIYMKWHPIALPPADSFKGQAALVTG
ncbi:hypothetical protein CHU98_g12600, partial [Xylaria longipes]